MKSIYTPAHSRTNIPEGFCLVKNILNNRYYYKCNQTIFIKGEIRDCKFVIRSDKYKNNITHGCIFEKLIIPTQKDINIQRIREKFLLALINVIGHCNISCRTINYNENGIFTVLLNTLMNLCDQFNLNKTTISLQYKNYLFKSINEYFPKELAKEDNPAEFWRILGNTENYKELSQVARIILSLYISEAICERGFSIRKNTTNKKQRRTLEDLANSKLYY